MTAAREELLRLSGEQYRRESARLRELETAADAARTEYVQADARKVAQRDKVCRTRTKILETVGDANAVLVRGADGTATIWVRTPTADLTVPLAAELDLRSAPQDGGT